MSFLYRLFAYLGFGPYHLPKIVLKLKKLVILDENDVESLDNHMGFKNRFSHILKNYNHLHRTSLKLEQAFFCPSYRFALNCAEERIRGWAACLIGSSSQPNRSKDIGDFLKIIALFNKFYPDKLKSNDLRSLIKNLFDIYDQDALLL